jgi:hypothetical protein
MKPFPVFQESENRNSDIVNEYPLNYKTAEHLVDSQNWIFISSTLRNDDLKGGQEKYYLRSNHKKNTFLHGEKIARM